MSRIVVIAVGLAAALLGAGAWLGLGPGAARRDRPASTPPEVPAPAIEAEAAAPAGVAIRFEDVAEASGVRFRHFDGRGGKQILMDSTAPGLAWLDYDGDGRMDLFLVQGSTFSGSPPAPAPASRLYRNEGGGRFRDASEALGPPIVGVGQGAAVGDVDNDGDPDLFVTFYNRRNALLRNDGGRFVEVAAAAGVADPPPSRRGPNWSTSAAFLDYDGDSFLDLFVCSYVEVDPADYPDCRRTCSPHDFRPSTCSLFRNKGDGTFVDASHEAGVDLPGAKALGVVALDLDDDGRTDLFVANDEMPNFLFLNRGGGRFESMGPLSGCTLNASGNTQAYMGVDADDLDGDGRPDLYATAYARETDTLFRNEGDGLFQDVTQGSGVGGPSWDGLAFGAAFLDPDADGSLDVFVANGHIDATVDELGDPANTFRQRAQLYRNDGRGRFRDASRAAGPYFQLPRVGRGVAPCDFDDDGRGDLAVANSGEPTALLRNTTETPNRWVRVDLRGTRSNRDAVGARVTLRLPGGRQIVRHRKGGGSYLSAADPRLLVGLGAADRVEEVEVRWPSGQTERFGPAEANRPCRIVEGAGRPGSAP